MSNSFSWDYFEKTTLLSSSKQNRNKSCLQASGDLHEILQLVKLDSYYPAQISLRDALMIRNELSSTSSCLEDLPWVVLRKIISCDATYREKELFELLSKLNCVGEEEGKEDSSSEDSDGTNDGSVDSNHSFFSDSIFKPSSYSLHPNDLILAIYQCCDPFLKRLLIKKMIHCGHAVPFLYAIERGKHFVSLWQLQNIFVDDIRPHTIADGRLTSIAFMRAGSKHCISKSEIVNNIIADECNIFFHKNRLLGNKRRHISQGMIEMFWCRLNGSKYTAGTGREPVLIYNLRGDALSHEKEVNVLLNISDIVVLIIDELKGDNRNLKGVFNVISSKKKKSFIFVYTKKTKLGKIKKTAEEIDSNIIGSFCEFIRLSKDYDKTPAEVAASHVKPCLAKALTCFKEGIDLVSGIREIQFPVLTDTFTTSVLCLLKEQNKSSLVTLQGKELWQKWTNLQQEKLRRQKTTWIEIDEYDQKLKDIRYCQIEKCNKESAFMAEFLRQLVENEDDEEHAQYFLSSIRICLDKKSREMLKSANNESLNSVVGLEHICREMGQIYEAFSAAENIAKKTSTVTGSLPRLVAKLFLLGQPLEIMDGDAENVPLTWLRSVFKETEKIIGKKKILSIAVLGVQSSGKSTMLNTMFGLEFAVSAGRCTRGIYAQLVPVSEETFGFDYVFVIDSEGLRSTSITDENLYKHDNKLSLLAMGLADVALVNVKGEISKELEDVLEMVVYGLLKLRKAEAFFSKELTAIFVHQNVAPQSSEAIERESQRFVKSLDEATASAAGALKIPDITTFSSIMKFKPERDIHCIPDLWKNGMTVNPLYSESVVSIANTILRAATHFKHAALSDIYKHLKSLWNCISCETSDWNYSNFRQDVAHMDLEDHLDKQLDAFNKFKEQNLIQIKINLKDCNISEYIQKFSKGLEERKETAFRELDIFVKKNSNGDFIPVEVAKQKIVEKVTEIGKCIEREQINEEIIKKLILKFEADSLKQNLDRYAETLAGQNSHKDTWSEEFSPCFDKFWKSETEPFLEDQEGEKKINEFIKKRGFEIACEKYSKHKNFFEDKNSHPDSFSMKEKIKNAALREKLQSTITDVKGSFKSHNVKDANYEEKTLIQGLEKISAEFEKWRVSENDQKYILLDVLQCSYQVFCEINSNFLCKMKESECVKQHFTWSSRFKEMFLKHLINVRKIEKEKRAKEAALREVKKALEEKKRSEEKMNEEMARARGESIAKEVKVSIDTYFETKMQGNIRTAFNNIFSKGNRKLQLIKKILLHLTDKASHSKYITYCLSPKEYALEWCEDYLTGTFNQFISCKMEKLKKEIESSLRSCYSYTSWMTSLERLMTNMDLNTGEITKLKSQGDISANEILHNKFTTDIKKIVYPDYKTRKKFEKVVQTLFNEMWGCCENCPWCGEPCTVAIHVGNSHQCIQHRQTGFLNMRDATTKKMDTETCNFLVESTHGISCGDWCICKNKDEEVFHPCVEYKNYMKDDWHIESLSDDSGSDYWKWVMKEFGEKIAAHFQMESPDIPSSWKKIDVKDAKDCLDN